MTEEPTARFADACATQASRLREPLAGSAPEARAWVLIPHPGPWGPKGWKDSNLPAPVVEWLAAADRAGVRPQLIRRLDRREEDPYVVLAGTRPGHEWARRIPLYALTDVTQLPPDLALADEPPSIGVPLEPDIILVCTHGVRDACCARLGRPVITLLKAEFGGPVFETTHTGGHRFAGNVVHLPSGVVFGALDPEEAVHAVRELRAGRIVLEPLRGRSGLDRRAQAAEVYVRWSENLLGLDDVEPGTVTLDRAGAEHDDCEVHIAFATPNGSRIVQVRTHEALPMRPVSCGADGSSPAIQLVLDG